MAIKKIKIGSTEHELIPTGTVVLTSDVTGSASFDDSGIVSISATVVDGSHNHSASNITSGSFGVSRGGTGKTTHTSNAILTGNGTSAVKNVATANGAFYATSANGAAQFGTLPIAQGGTGATSASAARTNFDVYSKAEVQAMVDSKAASDHTHDIVMTDDGYGNVTLMGLSTALEVIANASY